METQASIYEWFVRTFPNPSFPKQAAKIREEADELLAELSMEKALDMEAVSNEIADIMIVVMNLASVLGVDVQEAVAAKMAVNRQRRWKGSHHVA